MRSVGRVSGPGRRNRPSFHCREPNGEPVSTRPARSPIRAIPAPYLHLRRRHAASAGDAAALRLRQDRRGLRLQVRVLHHPDAARPLPQPAARLDRARSANGWPRAGVKELLLISQDTSFYGIDRGERGALARLLRALNRVDGLEWIRMLYLYPTTIGDDVLEAMAESEKVCRYIDLPLQHASDPVLKRMKRPGTRARLRAAARPHPHACAGRHACARRSSSASRGDRRGLRRARRASSKRSSSITSASSPTRTRKARRRTGSRTTCRRGEEARRNRPDAGRKKASSARPARDESAGRSGCWWTGRRPSTTSSCAGAARRPGAGHRPAGLPDRLRPRGASRRGSSSRPRSSAAGTTICWLGRCPNCLAA